MSRSGFRDAAINGMFNFHVVYAINLNHSERCFLLLTIQGTGKLLVQGLAIFRITFRDDQTISQERSSGEYPDDR